MVVYPSSGEGQGVVVDGGGGALGVAAEGDRSDVRVPEVAWHATAPPSGTWLRVTDTGAGRIEIWSTGFDLLGEASVGLNPDRQGVLRAQSLPPAGGIRLRYRGPDDLFPPKPDTTR
ncbi:hypothetical protein [Micromonospora okii]|uniref:hypothetical protein n=1 Tax=Micromonospora okii TaxID=1182970 RepID=UPI001E53CB36|nr:hypothetical protein [Micromonospora okii]